LNGGAKPRRGPLAPRRFSSRQVKSSRGVRKAYHPGRNVRTGRNVRKNVRKEKRYRGKGERPAYRRRPRHSKSADFGDGSEPVTKVSPDLTCFSPITCDRAEPHGRVRRASLRRETLPDDPRDVHRALAWVRDSPYESRDDDRHVRKSVPVRGTKVPRR
jgi:hypothetical protein